VLLENFSIRTLRKMVVLAACETGLGDLKQAEGTVGLQRAFLAKGARNVLVSLWVVREEATSQLLEALVVVKTLLLRKERHGL
jgi:CHAT domain-containing protein